ncbi:hypothetical protein DV736_g4214, partial [Chaetothyriales sp. CBS 134916]
MLTCSSAPTVLAQPVLPSIQERPSTSMGADNRIPAKSSATTNGVKAEGRQSESELSDPVEHAAEPGSSAPPVVVVKQVDMRDPATKQDAASSSDESVRPAKRKALAVDDEDFIRSNPDLYGLRRSGRARMHRTLAERPRKRLRQTSQRSSKQPSPSSDLASDSDSDAYGGRKARLSKKQKLRILQAANGLTPSHAELRFSTRRSAKVSTYNEDDEDDDMFGENDADVLTPNNWVNEEDTRPAIDIVLNHRLRSHVDSPSHSKDDYEFLIKWQQKAYYHATWETTDSLADVRSIRRLENYIRKTLMEEIRISNDPDIAPEDKEKWMLDREQIAEDLEDYKKVERVIGKRDGDQGGAEYLVKWKGLYYDQATWEPSSVVSEIGQSEIDRYINRLHENFRSDATQAKPGTRSKYEPVREQPSFIQNGTLRDFQMTGLNFLAYNWVLNKNVVLADEMGLGKTVQTVAFLSWLRHDRGQQGPFLVAVPLSTMPAWADTFDHWAPDINYVVYNGNQVARNIIKDYELIPDGNFGHARFHVLLTTYEYVLQDATLLSQLKWQFMAVDEAHRLKNRESQLYDRLREFKAPARLLITGTPVQNNLSELSSLFDFLNPGVVNIDENMDLTAEEASAKITELTESIKPYMLRRTKQKVEKDLPPKTEKIIRVELSDIQLEYYKNILTKNYAALNQGAKGPKQSLLNIMMELKKVSNHPFMFPSAEERVVPAGARKDEVLRALVTSSGKMMLLDQLLTKLKRDGHRVLIFSQMVKMLDILGDYMDYRGHAYQRLDGTIAAAPRRIAIDHFNAPDSTDFCFLLSTRAGGLGINLMTADTVIIFDSDWNPQADLQAMARAHRIGQTRPVSVYRLVSKETIEEEILERARNKLMLEFLTIQRGLTDKETQARRNALVGEPGSTSEISRILKKRGQRMFEQTDNQKKLEELDLDAVLEKAEDYKVEQPDGTDADGGEEFLKSFDFVDVKVDELSWDEIIPKEQLEEIRRDEQRKADEKYLAEVIEQNMPRVRNQVTDDRHARQARRQEQRQTAIDSETESDAGPGADPSRPLSEREYRYLVKGHLRYGSIDDRQEEFLQEARLRGRDLKVVKAAMKEIVDKATELYREEQNRMQELERTSNKPITKKDKKAVLFELHGVKRINAETILERPSEMNLLNQVIPSDPERQKSFRIPEATKSAGYSCPWGAREDGMLCVGILRHGYGAWERIRDDLDLDLKDKFFLEEHRVDKKAERERQENKNAKSPGAVHLVRRADYLLSVLKSQNSDDPAVKRAVENHHRNNKKHASVDLKSSDSPISNSARKQHRDIDRHRQRAVSASHRDSMERYGTPRADSRHYGRESESRDHRDRKHRDDHDGHHRHSNDHRRPDSATNGSSVETDQMMVLVFKPVRESLRRIKATTKNAIPDSQQRANELRSLLTEIGNFIAEQVADLEDAHTSMEKRFWDFAATYWPNKGIKGKELQAIHQKIVASDKKLAGDASPDESNNRETPKPAAMVSNLSVRNISTVPLTLVLVEHFNPEKDAGVFQLSNVTHTLAAVTNATGLTNATTQKAVAPIAAGDKPFATSQPNIKLPSFQIIQTDIQAVVHTEKERLRLTFQSDRGDKYRLNCPVPVSESARLEGPANAPVQLTGIFISDNHFVTLFTAFDLAKWQAKIPNDTPLGALSIPGTHNSPTCFTAPPSVRCQAVSPVEQLQKGVRFFDLRLQAPEPYDPKSDRLLLVHSVFPISLLAPKYFRDLYNEILKFLSDNPSETLIVSLKREGTGNGTDEQLSLILKNHYTNPHQWFTEPRVPTLGEARGRIVLFRRFALDQSLKGEWGGKGWGIDATGWADNTPNSTCPSGDVCIQDFYEVMEPSSITKKIQYSEAQLERSGCCSFDASNHATGAKKFPLYINFLTASNFWNIGTWPEKIAAQVNPAVLKILARQHMAKPDGGVRDGDWSTGIVITDWVGLNGNWDLFRAIVGMNVRLALGTRSFKHSHDLSNVTYGQFGIPSYHVDAQQWTFRRSIAQKSATDGNDDGASAISLKRIHQRTHSLDASITQISSLRSADGRFKSRQILKGTPELIPASTYIRALEREAAYSFGPDECPPITSQIVFGRAPYTNARNHHANSSQLSFLAVVSSGERDKISFWPLQSEKASATPVNDIEAPEKLPVLGDVNTWSAPLNEPILQLYHLPVAGMIAYRQSSASTLCLPFIHHYRTGLRAQSHPRVMMKQVLALPLSRTGNHPHADVALSCATGLQMAVVDVHGSYSVWEITGKRSLTTRLLYQARLRFSGKLWSWSGIHHPPRGSNPYFDGWHKICFLQPHIGYPLVLVANRQKAILCDHEGKELQNVDLRLESRFEWLLEVVPSRADQSKCILLTSSKILLLGLESTAEFELSLRLVCSSSHFLGDGRPGLRMSILELPNYLWVFLYSGKIPMLTLLILHEDRSLWTVNDLSYLYPFQETDLEASAMMDLACLPIHGPDDSMDSGKSTLLVMIVATHLDGRVTEALHLPSGIRLSANETGNDLITPWPEARRKLPVSDQMIDEDEDYDLFVVEDDDTSEAGPNEYHIDSWARRQRNTDKDWSWVYEGVDDCEKRVSMNSALEHAETQMQSSADLPVGIPLLRELIPAFQVGDIEEADKSFVVWREKVSTESHVIRSLYPGSESFGRVYEQMMSRFVKTLSDNVWNRLRVNTERLSRQVAMDLTLASLVVDQAVQAPAQSLDEDVPLGEAQQQSTTALDAAVSRLGKYTSFGQQWQSEPATAAIANILAHLPEDISTDPDDYSYSSIELDLARKRLQAQEVDPATKRRAERIEAIRRQRAEKAQATGKTALSQETPILVRGSSPVGQGIGMTQPERGGFGTRPLTVARSGKKKKHQAQRAGF